MGPLSAPTGTVTLISVLAVLTFIPTPYIYATRGGPYARLVNIGAAIWFVTLGLVLLEWPGGNVLAIISLIYPLMYLALSAAVAIRARSRV